MGQTYGQFRFAITKAPFAVGVDPELIDQYANDVYSRILHAREWDELQEEVAFPVTGAYTTGTLAAINGSNAIIGTLTVWTTAMTGWRIRISGRNEWYEFTFATATTGTLDGGFAGTTDSGLEYRLWQPIVDLPTDADRVISLIVPATDTSLEEIEQTELDRIDENRLTHGEPEVFAPYELDATTNGRQIELWPGPDNDATYRLKYKKLIPRFGPTDSSSSFEPWVNTECVWEGVRSKLLADRGDYTGSALAESLFNLLLGNMMAEDDRRRGPQRIKMDESFTFHRRDRAFGDLRTKRWWQLRRTP
jgi:hypothetical protein